MTDTYPPVAFHFKVAFAATAGQTDTSFQEVSGIEYEMQTEDYDELGENRFVHKLPTGVAHPNLVLKRGIASQTSPLVLWCRSVFESGLAVQIVPAPLVVMLLGESGMPIRTWSFASAFPVKWSVDSLNSTRNDVAIESIELSYTHMNRLL